MSIMLLLFTKISSSVLCLQILIPKLKAEMHTHMNFMFHFTQIIINVYTMFLTIKNE